MRSLRYFEVSVTHLTTKHVTVTVTVRVPATLMTHWVFHGQPIFIDPASTEPGRSIYLLF